MLEGVVNQPAIVDGLAHIDLGDFALIATISFFILLNMFDQVPLEPGVARDCDEGMNMQAVVGQDISQTVSADSFEDGSIWDSSRSCWG